MALDDLSQDVTALIATAGAVDAATAALRPLLDDLAAAELAIRKGIRSNGLPSRDHLMGTSQLRGLAISLLTGGSELDGTPLASIVVRAYGDLIVQEGGAA